MRSGSSESATTDSSDEATGRWFEFFPVCRFKPANVLRRLAANNVKQYSCFRSKLKPEGEGPASRSKTLAENGNRRAFTPAVILFIALPEAKDNVDPG